MKGTLRPILIPTKYTQKISQKSVEPFRRSATTNTVTRDFYILDDQLKVNEGWKKLYSKIFQS